MNTGEQQGTKEDREVKGGRQGKERSQRVFCVQEIVLDGVTLRGGAQ